MAISDITRATLRNDLRSRLSEIAPDKFVDAELNRWLNSAQFELFVKLVPYIGRWYGEISSEMDVSSDTVGQITVRNLLSFSTGAATDIFRLEMVWWITIGTLDNAIIPIMNIADLHSLAGNDNYNYACCLWGEVLYIYWISTSTLTNRFAYMYYLRKPDEMTSDSATMDIPSEYANLLILTALSKALGKLRIMQPKQDIDKDIQSTMREIEKTFSTETQLMAMEKSPGKQTPRVR